MMVFIATFHEMYAMCEYLELVGSKDVSFQLQWEADSRTNGKLEIEFRSWLKVIFGLQPLGPRHSLENTSYQEIDLCEFTHQLKSFCHESSRLILIVDRRETEN